MYGSNFVVFVSNPLGNQYDARIVIRYLFFLSLYIDSTFPLLQWMRIGWFLLSNRAANAALILSSGTIIKCERRDRLILIDKKNLLCTNGSYSKYQLVTIANRQKKKREDYTLFPAMPNCRNLILCSCKNFIFCSGYSSRMSVLMK